MPDVLLASLIIELISPRLLPTAVVAFLGRSRTMGFLFEVPLLRILALAHVKSPLRVSAWMNPHITRRRKRRAEERSRQAAEDLPTIHAERVTNRHHLPCGKLLPGRSETDPSPEELRARLLLSWSRMKASTLQWPWHGDVRRIPRRGLVVGAVLGVVLAIIFGVTFLIDEPLRGYTEAKVNRALKGYTAHIGKLNFHPIGLSLDVADLVVVQDAHPDPPIASIPLLSASVHWRALLHGRLVGDFMIDRPSTSTWPRRARRSPAPLPSRTAAGRTRWKRSIRSRSITSRSRRPT